MNGKGIFDKMVGTADTHALIVSASTSFHNYRHLSNALLVRDAVVRASGTSAADANVVLMLGGATPCDPRNARPGSVFAAAHPSADDLYSYGLQVDYRSAEVTVEAILGVLTDRPTSSAAIVPAHKRLRSGPRSRLLVYLTGHGGDEFLKFDDQFELSASELALAIRHAFALGRCEELLLLVDTCQASTLASQLPLLPPMYGEDVESATGERGAPTVPVLPAVRVAALSSSGRGENSYSHDTDREVLGVALSDRFTFQVHAYVTRASAERTTLNGLERFLQHAHLMSRPVRTAVGHIEGVNRADYGSRPLRRFFSAAPPRSNVIVAPTRRQHRTEQLRPSPKASTACWRRREAEALWGGLMPPALHTWSPMPSLPLAASTHTSQSAGPAIAELSLALFMGALLGVTLCTGRQSARSPRTTQ